MASNAGAQHEFGFSIALDGETLAVGAPFEHSPSREINSGEFDPGGFLNGAAYVFVRQDGMWTQEAYLKASNSDEWDWYGVSLDLHGDALVVGASGEASDTTDAAPDAA